MNAAAPANLAASTVWADAQPLPTAHHMAAWSDDIRTAPKGLLTGKAEKDVTNWHTYRLSGPTGTAITGLAFMHPDRPADQPITTGTGAWLPHRLAGPAGVLWATLEPEAAAAVAAAGMAAAWIPSSHQIDQFIQEWTQAGHTVRLLVRLTELDKLKQGRTAALGLMDLPAWGDCAEQVEGLIGQAMLKQQDQGTAQTTSAWPDPEPYRRNIDPAPPYPIEALPPLARDAASAIAYHVDAPLALAAQCVLGTLVYIAQRAVNAPDISHSQDGMPASLFILTEGASGDRKTACQTLADFIPHKVERDRMIGYTEEMASYRAMSAKDREGRPAPICPKTLYSDATLEPVISALINGAGNVMLSSDEAGQFFGGHTMKSDTARAAMGSLTKLWSSGIAERTRSAANAEGSGVAYDCRLSMNLLGQREVISESLRDPVMRGQGLLPRFLFAAPDSLAGTRFHRPTDEHNAFKDPRLQRYWKRCEDLLGVSADGLPPDLSGQPEADQMAANAGGRRVLPMHQEAARMVAALYEETERAQGKGGQFEFLRPFAARAEENARRVATVLAYFEGLPSITPEIMQAACRIIRYSLNEWRRYSDSAESDPDTARLQRLEEWLIAEAKATGQAIPRSRIIQSGPNYYRTAKILTQGLNVLEQAHRIRQAKQAGRAVVQVNPALLN